MSKMDLELWAEIFMKEREIKVEKKQIKKSKQEEEREIELRDIELVRTGRSFVVPEEIDLTEARAFIDYKIQEESTVIDVAEIFQELNPVEGAIALNEALINMFGFTKMGKIPPKSFFDSSHNPTYVRVPVSSTETVEIADGRISMPNVKGFIQHTWAIHDNRPVFQIIGQITGKDKTTFGALCNLVRKIAKEKSIYKGRAIIAKFPSEPQSVSDFFPDFMEVSDVDENSLIFSNDLEKLIKTTLFTPIEKTIACRKHSVPLKRGILLEGPFGVGKTLTAYVTAKKCVDNGWTFIYVNSAANIADAVEMAKQYQPAVVFTEDIDRAVGHERNENVNDILNRIDGITNKNTEVIVVLTTNNVDKISQAMLRPGRLDAVISVRPPEASAVNRLIRLFAGGLIKKETDLTLVSKKLEGQIPAVIREVVERAKLAAIGRCDDPEEITAEDMEVSTFGMLNHMKLLEPKKMDNRPSLEKAASTIATAIVENKSKTSNENSNGNGTSQDLQMIKEHLRL